MDVMIDAVGRQKASLFVMLRKASG